MARSIEEVYAQRGIEQPQEGGATERAMREANEQAKLEQDQRRFIEAASSNRNLRQKAADMISSLINSGLTVPPDIINSMLKIEDDFNETGTRPARAAPPPQRDDRADAMRMAYIEDMDRQITQEMMMARGTDPEYINPYVTRTRQEYEQVPTPEPEPQEYEFVPMNDYGGEERVLGEVGTIRGDTVANTEAELTAADIDHARDALAAGTTVGRVTNPNFTYQLNSAQGALNDLEMKLNTVTDPMRDDVDVLMQEVAKIKAEMAGIQEAIMLLAQLLEGKQPPRERKEKSDG